MRKLGDFRWMCSSLCRGPCSKLVFLRSAEAGVLLGWSVRVLLGQIHLLGHSQARLPGPLRLLHQACRLAGRGYSKNSHLTLQAGLAIPRQGIFCCGLGNNNLFLMSSIPDGHQDESRILLLNKNKNKKRRRRKRKALDLD